MGYENEPYRDENGEPLVDLDKNVGSERNEPQQHVLDVACSKCSEGSLTPVYNDTNSKGRKLIIKIKSVRESGPAPTPVYNDPNSKCGKLLIKLNSGRESGPTDSGLDGNDVLGLVRDDWSDGRKKKKEKGENRRNLGKKRKVEKGEIKSRVKKSGRRGMKDHDVDSEIKEMWDTVAGGNSEVESP